MTKKKPHRKKRQPHKQHLETGSQSGKPPTSAAEEFEDTFREGTALLHAGKHQSAVPPLERAYELQPHHVDAGINLAGAYILNGQFKKAVAVLEPLAEQQPNHAMIWTNLGAAYLGNPILAGDEEQREAIRAFQHALEINPAAPNVAYNLGLIFRDRREKEKAIYWFEQAIHHNPADRHARRILEKLSSEEEE